MDDKTTDRVVADKMATAAVLARKRPHRRLKAFPTVSLAQFKPHSTKKKKNKTIDDDDDDDYDEQEEQQPPKDQKPLLSERESLLIWAAARAAVSLKINSAVAPAVSKPVSRILNLALIQLSASEPLAELGTGMPDSVVMQIEPDGTTIQTVREQLQTQLQELLNRRHLALSKPNEGRRPLISILGIYDADDIETCSSMLLDNLTSFPTQLVASFVVYVCTN